METTSPTTVALPLIEAGQRVTVRVPATSANLGPGYDSLGLALALHDTLTVESLDTANWCSSSAARGRTACRATPATWWSGPWRPPSHGWATGTAGSGLRRRTSIPMAVAWGRRPLPWWPQCPAANAMVPAAEQRGRDWILQLTSEMEGHPDNVAPAIFGGLALSWQDSDQYRSTCATVVGSVIPIVAVPDFELSTEAARALLPASVGHHAAAMNSGRAALLIHALTQKPEFLLAGTEDYLHQSYRAEAMRPSAALIRALRSAGHAAVVSGAGPTVLVLANGEAEAAEILALIESFTAANTPGIGWRVLKLAVDVEGAKVDLHRR